MRISFILNTAALDPWVQGNNPHRSQDYRQRYQLVKERVLPAAIAQDFDEIIVAGVYEAGEGYQYVPVAPVCRDRRDALHQREQGARHATGDILVFSHDDHMLADDFVRKLRNWIAAEKWDLLVPRRVHAITGADLNNGLRPKNPMMGGHTCVLKRWLWARVPWTKLDFEYWDESMTREWQTVGGVLRWASDVIHYDIEAAVDET